MTNATSLLARPRRTAAAGGLAKCALAALAAAVSLALIASPAGAEVIHPNVTGEYGLEGPAASGLGGGCTLAYESAENRLYVLGGGKIYALHRTGQGAVAAVGGEFPISVPNGFCGLAHVTVDQQSGHVFYVPDGGTLYGYDATGAGLANFPVEVGGELCGLATTGTGEIWGGNWSAAGVSKVSPTGSPLETFSINSQDCKIEVDHGNGDLFALPYYGPPIVQLTASSGYASSSHTYQAANGEVSFAVDGTHHKIYVPDGEVVLVYDTTSGRLLEEVHFGGSTQGLTVDEATQTLFVSDRENNVIKELPAALVPTAVTGEPTGNTSVSGNADPDGGAAITECKFEYGTQAGSYSQEEPCEGAAPFNGAVSANLPGLTPETTYHYRLVLGTGAPGFEGRGGDMTITPHAILGVTAKPADPITPGSATLNGQYQGTGTDVHYYFEWGSTTQYGNTTPTIDAGSGTGVQQASQSITGFETYRTYHYRLVAYVSQTPEGTTRSQDATFEAAAPLPGISDTGSAVLSDTSVRLYGTVSPNYAATLYRFDYGSTDEYGESTLLSETPLPGDGSAHPVEQTVSGLSSGTLYHFRLVAINFTGVAFGPDQTVLTPGAPKIDGSGAGNVLQTTARLTAQVNPNSAASEVHFEYGPTTAYGSSSPAVAVGSGTADVPAAADLAGLAPGTLYHYRAVAVNAYGTTVGIDGTFTTSPGSPPEEERKPQKCKRGFVLRHGKCVKKHHRHRRHRHSKRRSG